MTSTVFVAGLTCCPNSLYQAFRLIVYLDLDLFVLAQGYIVNEDYYQKALL